MLRTTRNARKNVGTTRLRIVKLEARIAPTCHQNPHGKLVGNCGK